MKRGFHLLGQVAALAISWGVIFEIGLRIQQSFGPLYDLEMANINLSWESSVLNHRPSPENQSLCIYGDATGFTYEKSYDANGIRIVDDTELRTGCRNPASVLFLGDSFMEGFDDENTLPYHVAKYFKTEREICLKTFNAGFTSYSPAIFVPQAKRLLPIVRPDYIVVDVDETDLYDDYARYRKLIVRNERGENVGVGVSPIGHECSVGLMEARKYPLYLMRFAAKLWHSYVHMPAVIGANRPDFELFSYSQDHDVDLERKYSRALAAFRHNLEELAGILKDYTRDGNRVLFIFHPHLEHLKPDASGRARPIVIPGSEFVVPCDVVVVAIGTRANPLLTATCPDLKLNKWGNIVVDEKGMTNLPGVFAGGDIVRGAATVILAMGDGKRAAKAMDEYLRTAASAAPAAR